MLSHAYLMLIADCGRLTWSRFLPDQIRCGGTQCLLETRLLAAMSICVAEQILETSAELAIVASDL